MQQVSSQLVHVTLGLTFLFYVLKIYITFLCGAPKSRRITDEPLCQCGITVTALNKEGVGLSDIPYDKTLYELELLTGG